MIKFLTLLALAVAVLAYEYDGNLMELNGKDFEKAIAEFPYIMVMFYSPKCKHWYRLHIEAVKWLRSTTRWLRRN
jgi:hypothetical protein